MQKCCCPLWGHPARILAAALPFTLALPKDWQHFWAVALVADVRLAAKFYF